MAELQPPEGPISTGEPPPPAPPQPPLQTTTTALPQVSASADNQGPCLAPKRQRRPSVRLGEIGDQSATLSYDSHVRRGNNKLWRLPHTKDSSNKASKLRPLTNLVNGGGDYHEILEREDKNFSTDTNLDFNNRRSKEPPKAAKRASTKRVRSNWGAKIDDSGADGDDKFSSRGDGDGDCDGDGFRDFELEGSDSPFKDPSPVHSVGYNEGLDLWHEQRGPIRARVSDDGIELDRRDRKCETSANGVRTWLIGLGLGQYAPVFEIHEVDDEVLPLLTLEDLKDMGINAVGSRRKMYTAIQRLRKGFS